MVDAILRIFALHARNCWRSSRTRAAGSLLLIPPMLQCLIYGYVATYDLNDVPYAVLDQDRSPASRDLLARLDGSRIFRRVANLTSSRDIEDIIDGRRALLVIQHRPVDFERQLWPASRPTCR